MNTLVTQHLNDLKALQAIHRFGFLRAAELGRLMWPGNATNKQQGQRLLRKLIERGLVIQRDLPLRAGQAAVLAQAGVRLLAREGISSSTGKDIGSFPGQHKTGDAEAPPAAPSQQLVWQPPASWRHDVYASGVLTLLMERGWTVMPEAEVRRRAGRKMAKLPDGLARDPEGNWWWLEQERARKSGPAMRQLADALIAVSDQAVSVAGVRPVGALLAYVEAEASKDEQTGHAIDHKARVISAIQARAKSAVRVTFVPCKVELHGVVHIGLDPIEIPHAGFARILKALNSNGWKVNEDEIHSSNYAGFLVEVWEEDEGWGFQVTREGVPQPANRAANIEEAKRKAAELINAS